MKKYFYLFVAAVAMMLTACSSEEVTNDVRQTPKEAIPMAVGFDTYTSNATRAVAYGVMTTTTLQTTGFGVFAWQGAITPGYSDAAPNFMYNEEISYPSGAWTYSPLKYWPNETSNDTGAGNTATSTHSEGLSFLAYAPYVSAASGTTGITSISANTAVPTIGYTIATAPSQSVDLLWGVAQADGFSYDDVTGGTTSVAAGKPLLNLKKPSKEQKIKFLFKHALARLGVSIVAAVDQVPAGGKLDDDTKIYVTSITIADGASTKTLPTTGTLNLNNTVANVANWSASPGTLSLVLNASNELSTAIQTGGTGVTTTEQNAIEGGKYFMLIPTQSTQATFDVTIDYTVETTDSKVSGGKVSTQNVIKKTVVVGDPTKGFENNKAYNLKIILGLTSVKLDAEVADWEVQNSTDVDLPKNM